MNPQALLCLCSSCGSRVMLQIVPKIKVLPKTSLSQELLHIRSTAFKMYALYYIDV